MATILSSMSGTILRVRLSGGEIWEILTDKLTAVKIPQISEKAAVVYNEPFDSIEDYLTNKGFKQIQRLSNHVVTFEEKMPRCTRCKTNKNVVKAGRQNMSKSQHRRFLCKDCNYRFTVD